MRRVMTKKNSREIEHSIIAELDRRREFWIGQWLSTDWCQIKAATGAAAVGELSAQRASSHIQRWRRFFCNRHSRASSFKRCLLTFLWRTPIRLIKCNWCNCVMMDGSLVAVTIACWKINKLSACEAEPMQRELYVNGRLNSIQWSHCAVMKQRVNCFKIPYNSNHQLFSISGASTGGKYTSAQAVFKNKPCASPRLSPAKAAIKITNSIIQCAYTEARGVRYNSTSEIYGIALRVMFMYQRFYQICARHHLILCWLLCCLPGRDQTRLECCNVPRNRPRRKSRRPTSLHKFYVACTCVYPHTVIEMCARRFTYFAPQSGGESLTSQTTSARRRVYMLFCKS